jgi:hypothetical protein
MLDTARKKPARTVAKDACGKLHPPARGGPALVAGPGLFRGVFRSKSGNLALYLALPGRLS